DHQSHAAGIDVLVVGLEVGIVARDVPERPHPEVVRVGQDVGLGDQGYEPDFALLAVFSSKSAEGPFSSPAAGQVEGESEAALDAGAGVDRSLDGDLFRSPLAGEAAGANIKILVILPDDDQVDVVGSLAPDRGFDARIEADRPEVHVLVELEAEA